MRCKFIPLIFCLCLMQNGALAAQGSELSSRIDSAERAMKMQNSTAAASLSVRALQSLMKSRVSASDRQVRVFMFDELPSLIQDLSMTPGGRSSAVTLAKWKLAAAEAAFGKSSVYAVDSLVDLMMAQRSSRDLQASAATEAMFKSRLSALNAQDAALAGQQLDRKVQALQAKVQQQAMSALTGASSTIRRALGK